MTSRTLVAYATRFGSTERAAEIIAQTLRASGSTVDCYPMEDVGAIDNYNAVAIGSAVNYAAWLPVAIDFIREHQTSLSRMPVALFTVHIRNLSDDPTERCERLAYLDGLRPYVLPVSEGFFAGRFNRHAARELMPGWAARFIPTINHMKPEKIRAWAATLPSLFQVQTKGVQDVTVNH